MPMGVAQAIEKLQRSFFLGDGLEKRNVHLVDWASICKSKRGSGLGVGRILDKNKSLLAKLVWRFGREVSSLWKGVICAKYDLSEKGLRWDWKVPNSGSFFVKAIQSLFETSSETASLLQEGLKVVVGNGERARLWTDLLWDSIPLKSAFPRIFALAAIKDGLVKDYGKWIRSK
ncbi:hypothetical protein Dsin_014045 [Dipteronia sinensis]|uniref:Uncharacterized protein n=1 Tax=Dipteronia sinensis TaxID=43782 RepID=A0AAE0EB70_9ROSI|nr:hypothetical protein Dsin_014045 [Dipteronia sinensis]